MIVLNRIEQLRMRISSSQWYIFKKWHSQNVKDVNDIPPGFTEEVHPEIFSLGTRLQASKGDKKPGQISDDMMRQFFEQGFLVINEFFTPEELEPVRQAFGKLVDDLAQKLYKAGKIPSLYEEYDNFKDRLIKLEKEFPGSALLVLKVVAVPQAIVDLWSNERLLNLVEQIIGPDIVGHPVWNIRPKIKDVEASKVPWHQDSGYFDKDSYKTFIPTAWIPLIDATEENGCLQFVKKGHQKGAIAKHKCYAKDSWFLIIDEDELKERLEVDLDKDIITAPVPFGGLVLFNNMIPHRSLPNKTDVIRWTIDFRWTRKSDPIGFFGIKDGILMRSADNPDLKPNWSDFNSKDRHSEQKKMEIGEGEGDFDVSMHGPWLQKWVTAN